ncbi:MAG: asparaginase [Anaerolineaceae bacterium]|nr:asparaginase [Anaerolineaceae bacterium]
MPETNYKPVVEVTRGNVLESIHFGAIAVVDATGRMLAGYGDPYTVTFLRSSSKPFQALPLIEMGGMEYFGLSEAEVAIQCASHSGTDAHYEVVSAFQQKVGVGEEDLKCGTHPPMHEPTWKELIRRGEAPTPNRHNCSGKHTGMLAQIKMRSLPYENYLDVEHPVQKTILQTFAEMCDLDPQKVPLGMDGCSAPVFAAPLFNAALGYARLSDPHALPPKRAAACRVITQAMMTHPDMVAGPDRFDTVLMQAGQGKIFSKMGAEGYQGIGVLPDVLEEGSPGIGIALKISDGDLSGRAAPLVAVEVLRQLDVLDGGQIDLLKAFYTHPVLNWRKLEIGEIQPAFNLIYFG